MVTAHSDDSCTDVDTRVSHIYTLTHILLQSHSPTRFHRHSSSDSRVIFCCGHMMAHRDMLYRRLMGRPHMCLSHQQSGSSHGVREKVSFDESIQDFAIKRSHTKAILIFISKTKLRQGLWGASLCFRPSFGFLKDLHRLTGATISWAHLFTQP